MLSRWSSCLFAAVVLSVAAVPAGTDPKPVPWTEPGLSLCAGSEPDRMLESLLVIESAIDLERAAIAPQREPFFLHGSLFFEINRNQRSDSTGTTTPGHRAVLGLETARPCPMKLTFSGSDGEAPLLEITLQLDPIAETERPACQPRCGSARAAPGAGEQAQAVAAELNRLVKQRCF